MSLIITGAVAGALAAAAPSAPHTQPSAPGVQLDQAASPGLPYDLPEDQRDPGKSPADLVAEALGEQAHREPGWRAPHGFARPSPDRDFPTLPTTRQAGR